MITTQIWRRGLRVAPSVLVLLAISALAGCLPDEEETLGSAPPGPAGIFYDFEDSIVPPEFVQTLSGGAPAWSINSAGGCNGASCLYSGAMPADDSSCVTYDEAVNTTEISFIFDAVLPLLPGALTFQIDGDTVFSTTNTSTNTVSRTAGAFGRHAYRWCVDSPGGAGAMLYLDDIRID